MVPRAPPRPDFARDCGWDGPSFRGTRTADSSALPAFFHLTCRLTRTVDWRPARRWTGFVDAHLANLKRHPHPARRCRGYLNTFPGVGREEQAKHGEYRIKRITLEIYDAMRHPVTTGGSYQTDSIQPRLTQGLSPTTREHMSELLIGIPHQYRPTKFRGTTSGCGFSLTSNIAAA